MKSTWALLAVCAVAGCGGKTPGEVDVAPDLAAAVDAAGDMVPDGTDAKRDLDTVDVSPLPDVLDTADETPPADTIDTVDSEAPEAMGGQPEIGSMVLIHAGNLNMGCNFPNGEYEGMLCQPNNTPYHPLYIDTFYIGVYEVTVGEYFECVEAGGCEVPEGPKGPDADVKDCTYGKINSALLPITCVTWYQAVDYCIWRGGRLCTEAEWEKAARGCCDGRYFPWGNELPTVEHAVLMASGADPEGKNMPYSVGSRPSGASPYGIQDMAGNVSEFVSDWFSFDYYTISPFDNPKGPENGEKKVQRGSFGGDIIPEASTTFRRSQGTPTYSWPGTGFRCCAD